MSIDPEWKMIRLDLGRIEKWVLRNAFDDDQKTISAEGILVLETAFPSLFRHILYRQRGQFSDGDGYSWIDGLKDHADKQVTDAMLMNASFIYPENTPSTKEGYYYRTIFETFFPKVLYCLIYFSIRFFSAYLDFLEGGQHHLSTCPQLVGLGHFPIFEGQNAARSTVPGGPSVACRTAEAVEWDAAWAKNPDPSGCAALGVHASAYEEAEDLSATNPINDPPQKIQKGIVEKTATVV
ncbi:hypothetical protein CRYUN_Cryun24cG0036600 [Craigia yunnanensis]